MEVPPPDIRCSHCGQGPDVVRFLRDKSTASGWRHWCCECKSEKDRETRARRSSSTEIPIAQPVQIAHSVQIEPRREPAIIPGLRHEGRTLKVVGLGDIHAPFHSERGIRLALELIGDEKPDVVVQLGDLYDQLSFGKYPRSFNVYKPKDEIGEGRLFAESLWLSVRHRVPNARLVQLRGNHDDRAYKRLVEHLPAIESLAAPAINALFRFDGVETVDDSREEFELEGVLYHHGHRRFGQHVSWNMRPTVNGHLHVGGVVFKQTEAETIWELNVGFLGDKDAPCFTYRAQRRMHGTTLGVGIIDRLGPRFVPFG